VKTTPTDPEPAAARAPDRRAARREWILALGDGSFAMGTGAGVPTRRYHGTLIASAAPPVRREHLVGPIDERVEIDGRAWTLTPLAFGDTATGDDDAPTATPGTRLTSCELGPGTASWSWDLIENGAAVARVTKRRAGADGAPGVRVSYELESNERAALVLTPLMGLRNFHEINHPGSIDGVLPDVHLTASGATVSLGARAVSVRPDGFAIADTGGEVWRGLRYAQDRARGQADAEDLFAPVRLIAHASASVVFERPGAGPIDYDAALTERRARVEGMTRAALAAAGDPIDDRLRGAIASLATSADAFIVRRDDPIDGARSIIAGYPWFSDWGRDTMIALEGLMLVTGRHDEALAALRAFAHARGHGLIPNRFDDDAGPAHFNTIDASLWFVHACARWGAWKGTPIPPDLLDAVRDVVGAYECGTIHAIAMDPRDALIAGGDATTQLTWMDALRDGVAFTPRHGKAVEINALWIRALRILEAHTNNGAERDRVAALADRALGSFSRVFAPGPRGGLKDTQDDASALRPNQVFAGALPIGLDAPTRNAIIDATRETLVTPAGVRTLAPGDPGYEPRYAGGLFERDRAYHNGTVWPWLLGPWCEALLRARGHDDAARREATDRLAALASRGDALNSIHEVYDAEPEDRDGSSPGWRADGCPAQAWSVAETLRVLVLACDPGSTPKG